MRFHVCRLWFDSPVGIFAIDFLFPAFKTDPACGRARSAHHKNQSPGSNNACCQFCRVKSMLLPCIDASTSNVTGKLLLIAMSRST